MLSREALANNWNTIIKIYKETIKINNPKITVKKIIDSIGYDNTIETFAAISRIKKHDGRIYGKNREFMDSIHLIEDVDEYNHDNPLLSCDLDYIHPVHINNLITELRYGI